MAWHRVYGARRTETGRAGRRVFCDCTRIPDRRPERTPAEETLAVLVDGVERGTLSLGQADALAGWVAGWSSAEVAAAAGVTVAAVRARRHRGMVALAAAGSSGGW
jgi:DNA-directed RNA polymerase specialized sigma24 family protein